MAPRPPCTPFSVLHSMRYLSVAVSEPSPGVPQSMEIGFVDGIPITRYNSERGRLEPLTQWMKDGVELEYWDRETQRAERNQHMDARSLERVQERYNQSRREWGICLHTLQRLIGCELMSDGSVRGSYQYGYDGRDFISFDLEYGRFVAADGAAEITRRRWENEGIVAESMTNYLKHECPEWLQKHVRNGEKELERKGGWELGIWDWRIGEHDPLDWLVDPWGWNGICGARLGIHGVQGAGMGLCGAGTQFHGSLWVQSPQVSTHCSGFMAVSSCLTGVSVDPRGTATTGKISSPLIWDLGDSWRLTALLRSPGGSGNRTGPWLSSGQIT
uniref:MHC class I-like antigen recognition-like domain-containing protein n=1 Tax=Zosterops lateralis melanops TaxID=1220523 RepID=A0A8D2PBL0_ZOSLA